MKLPLWPCDREAVLLELLEDAVDADGLEQVLDWVGQVCDLKAADNWQDMPLARKWAAAGERVYRAANSVAVEAVDEVSQ